MDRNRMQNQIDFHLLRTQVSIFIVIN